MNQDDVFLAVRKGQEAAAILDPLTSEQQAAAMRAMVMGLHVELKSNRIVALPPMPTEEEKERWGI